VRMHLTKLPSPLLIAGTVDSGGFAGNVQDVSESRTVRAIVIYQREDDMAHSLPEIGKDALRLSAEDPERSACGIRGPCPRVDRNPFRCYRSPSSSSGLLA
jgi:hypothetical protein